MNYDYEYENKQLWQASTWEGRASRTDTLCRWIASRLHIRRLAAPKSDRVRLSGVYDQKTSSITVAETIAYWEQNGLHYYCREMGGIRWVTMIPRGYGMGLRRNPTILTVLCDVDYANPYWAMDLLEEYREYCLEAAQQKTALLLIAHDGVDESNTYVRVLQEAAAVFHLDLKELWLDISEVIASGERLSEVSALKEEEMETGTLLQGLHIPALRISDLWQNRVSQIYVTTIAPSAKAKGFSFERLVNSRLGKRMAEAMRLQLDYTGGKDPELFRYWHNRGVRYDRRYTNSEAWIIMAPHSALEDMSQPLPLVIAMQEVVDENPHATLIAMSYHYGLCELAAAGEAIVLFFALETPDDNELLCDLIREAKKEYPIDSSRIYMTGHSHNGMYSLAFAQRHPELIAGVCTLGNPHGLPGSSGESDPFHLSDARTDALRQYDMPLININGELENELIIRSAKDMEDQKEQFHNWQRRLYTFHCPEPSFEDFAYATTSFGRAGELLGITGDWMDVVYCDGYLCALADVYNDEGKRHLRFATIEGMIHLNVPIMADLMWSFLSRFSRNQETGKIMELY